MSLRRLSKVKSPKAPNIHNIDKQRGFSFAVIENVNLQSHIRERFGNV